MKAQSVRGDDRLDVAEVEAPVLLAEAVRLDEQEMVGPEPHARSEDEAAPPAGKLLVFHPPFIHLMLPSGSWPPDTSRTRSTARPAPAPQRVRQRTATGCAAPG